MAWSGGPSEERSLPITCSDCNILYISIDPLAAGHMGVYGYPRNTTPALNRLAEESFVFSRAFSQSGHTLPALYSTFTSTYPRQHGMTPARAFEGASPNPDLLMLAEVLNRSGYHTFSVNGGANVRARYGLGDGFRTYLAALTEADGHNGTRNVTEGYPSLAEQKRALKRMIRERDGRFFAFFQSFNTHDPYFPPPPYDAMFIDELPPFHAEAQNVWQRYTHRYGASDRLYTEFRQPYFGNITEDSALQRYAISQYDGEVRRADAAIGDILRLLRAEGIYNDTIIIVNAQHGEQFGEHGKWRHVTSLYNEVIHVPLIIRLPNQESGRTIDRYVENLDIAPTLLHLVEDRNNVKERFLAQTEGVSLLPAMQGNTLSKPFLLAEGEDMQAVINPATERKYYWNGSRTVVYNLDTDFEELHPIRSVGQERIQRMFGQVSREIGDSLAASSSIWPYTE